MKEIYLTGKYGSKIGNYALVDDDLYDYLNKFKWHAEQYSSKKKTNMKYYAAGMINGKNTKMHRFIMNIIDVNIKLDHKNGDTLDNQKNNLRIATSSQNNANRKKLNRGNCNYKGVHLRDGKYIAQISYNKKKEMIGVYNTSTEAAIAYDIKAIELHGEFAVLNFPNKDYSKIKTPIPITKTSNTGYPNIYYEKEQDIYIVNKVVCGIKYKKKSKSLEKAIKYLEQINENSINSPSF